MKKTIKVASILHFLAATLYLLALVFMLLDVSSFQIGFPKAEGWEAVGNGFIYVLALIFQYTTSLVASVFHIVVGGCLCSALRKGTRVHMALRVLMTVFGVIAILVNVFFICCYFDIGFALWGALCTVATLVSVAALGALFACKTGNAAPVVENVENIEIDG